ncbi:MAG TPA: GNAT family N-acetyltransferase [Gemmatimonadales bacterium]
MDAVRSVLIRRGRPDEAGALAAFGERVFREAFAAQNRAADLEMYIGRAYGHSQQLAELNDPDVTTLVAEVEGKLAGFAQVRPGETPPCVPGPAPIELWRFYVDRPFQGMGVAGRLMQAVVESALARDARTLWLGVWERNPRAQGFYRKCGFVDVGKHAFVLGSDIQTDRVMARPLVSFPS